MDQPPVLESLSRVLVTFPRLGAQGVLIPGGFVLTAAHCLVDEKNRTPYPHNKAFKRNSLAFTAKSPQGIEFPMVPLFMDLISDVAILEHSKQLEHYKGNKSDYDLFPNFAVAEVESIHEFLVDLPIDLDIRWRKAWVHIHQKGWHLIRVKEGLVHDNHLIIESEVPIGPDSAGSPIVTKWGKLLGVVSGELTQKKNKKHRGSFAHAFAVLPTWYHWEMEDQEEDEDLD